jgi:uncharacterized protein involved in response to NO
MNTLALPFPISPRLLAAAPHRMLFAVGAANVLLAMAWWAAWLGAARFGWTLPSAGPYAGWLHAFVMQYQMLPSFVFGFLLTTFPRWMGLPDIDRWRYAPVGIGLFGGQVATLLGAIGWEAGIVVGAWMTLAGWLAGIATLGPLLLREKGTTWHARSCFAALLALSSTALARWWPKGRKPFILTALFIGYAWLPVAFALYAVQSLAYLVQGDYLLGRGPAHALFIGFFGSVLVAMVTRVTQGHSGRPLAMPGVAVYAFIAITVVAVMRIVAEVSHDPMLWQTLAAAGWLLALTPWIVRLGMIYLAPRVDGRPG